MCQEWCLEVSRLYGIIDLARAVELRSYLAYLKAPKAEPLLDRDGYPDLLAVGPWIVDLSMTPEVVEIWRERGRWKSWGYTVRSEECLMTLRRHLRKFNLVEIEGNDRPVFFRYFDPEVLLLMFMEVFTQQQIAEFKGNIDVISIEDRVNHRLLNL